jgi:hypothetical protein
MALMGLETDATVNRRQFLRSLPFLGGAAVVMGVAGQRAEAAGQGDRLDRLEMRAGATEHQVADLGNLVHDVNKLKGDVLQVQVAVSTLAKGEAVLFERAKGQK